MTRWLAIGVGNTLRRDDGVGPWLAARAAAWRLRDVVVRVCPCLGPELASEVAESERVVFLDAATDIRGPRLLAVQAGPPAPALGHALSAMQVLELTRQLYPSCPPAWLLAVPGSDFGFGEELSPTCRRHAANALRILRRTLQAQG